MDIWIIIEGNVVMCLIVSMIIWKNWQFSLFEQQSKTSFSIDLIN